MSKDTYDAMAPIERGGKTRWVKVGVGFGKDSKRKGNGYQVTVHLDCMPLPHEWDGRLVLFEKKEVATTKRSKEDDYPDDLHQDEDIRF